MAFDPVEGEGRGRKQIREIEKKEVARDGDEARRKGLYSIEMT